MPLLPTTVLGIDPDVVAGDVEGEIVALRASADAYLHLNGTGSFIFERLRREPMTLAALCAVVSQRYDVDPATGRRETAAFVTRCIEIGLLRQENP